MLPPQFILYTKYYIQNTFPNFGLYCITDNRVDPLPIIKNWIYCGVKMIQFRNKNIDDKSFADIAWKIRKLTWGTDSKFIINDRIEIAKEVDADGIHLGQDDIKETDFTIFGDLDSLRKYLSGQKDRIGNKKIVGLSSHSYEEAMRSYKMKPDYLAIGPFYFTPTHDDYTPVGFDTVAQVIEEIKDIPVVTIGGIDSKNLNEVLKTGVKNVAMVREVNEKQSVIPNLIKALTI